MRPLGIEFSAFGSYPGEVTVDFDSLRARGLFLVTGETGTGKTTIFDAMSYALYDKMPMKDAGDIRSHHADSTQRTWVRFTFSLDGTTYRAERHPTQTRPAKRGGGTTEEKAGATLVSVDSDGSTTAIATGSRDVQKACIELIGLDADQFQRVMLLAQGAVNQFLIENSSKREELLATLFGGDLYERVTDHLKQEARRLGKACEAIDNRIAHHLENARTYLTTVLRGVDPEGEHDVTELDREALEAAHNATADARGALDARAASAKVAETEAQTALTDAKAAHDRFERAESIATALTELGAKEAQARADTAAGQASQAARPVVNSHATAAEAAQAEQQARAEAEALRDSLSRIAEGAGLTIDTSTSTAINRSITEHRQQVEKDQQLVATADKAQTKLSELEAKVATDTEALAGKRADSERIAAEVAEAEQQLTDLTPLLRDQTTLDNEAERINDASKSITERGDLTQLVEEWTEKAQSADDHYNELQRQFIATAAPRLAKELRDGEACPVCGSPEHPNPARDESGEAIDLQEVEEAKERKHAVFTELEQHQQNLQRLRERLGELADADADAISRQLIDAEAARKDNIERGKEISEIEAKLKLLRHDRDAATKAETTLEANLETAKAAVTDATNELTAALAACAGIDTEALSRRVACVEALTDAAAPAESSFSAVAAAEKLAADRRGDADTALANSAFDTIAAAEAALMDSEAEQDALKALANWEAAKAKLDTELATLKDQGVPDIRPDLEAATALADSTRQESERLASTRTTVNDASDNFTESLSDLDKEAADSVDERKRYAVAERAARVCNGQSGPRVNLRRWILGRELERVTLAASVHLRSMTGGRYGIQRATEVTDGRRTFGLDLEILDAHTGRARSPKSLSGGEQFQASLALALGLADVVSQGGSSSGRRVEALFIDEGFGSLDPHALDDAIETLHHLQATGRTIGAITHVEAMKERLHPGIVVTRHPSGKGSVLTVNP